MAHTLIARQPERDPAPGQAPSGQPVTVEHRQRPEQAEQHQPRLQQHGAGGLHAAGYTARIPQLTITASTPRWRTSRPARTTAAALASAVRTRPAAIPAAVPVALVASATGAVSSVIPGGWTMMKSR